VVEQPEYHLFHRERVEVEYRRLYEDIGIGLTTWSPLASGLLTGKYRNGVPADSRGAIPRMKFLVEGLTDRARNDAVGRLEGIAKELGCSLAQLAIAWCARNPNVSTVITGASRVSQVEENLAAADVIAKLTPAVMERIDAIASPLAA
jgi:aryl-alcohol dehydrogenase-like predicted oxidoreductase